MIFHRLRVISFSKSLLSIRATHKNKTDLKVDSENIANVEDKSMLHAAEIKHDIKESTTECINPVNSSNNNDPVPVKPRLAFKSKSEPIRISLKTLKKRTSRKTLSLGDLRRRFSLKETLNSTRISQKLQSYKREKAKKNNTIAKKNEIKVLYAAGPWSRKRRHYAMHLRKPVACQSQNLFGFYRNQRLFDPYTFYQRYNNDNNPFQKFRARTARKRKKLSEVPNSCRHIHHPLKIITSCKNESSQPYRFCTNPLHYNVLSFPSKSKLSKSQHSLRLYRSKGFSNDCVRCSRSVKDKPCPAANVSRGQMMSTSRLNAPVLCVDTAVSGCSYVKQRISKSCRVKISESGHQKYKHSMRKFPVSSLYSNIFQKHLAFTLGAHFNHRSSIRNIIKNGLLGLVIIMWSPCIFGVMVGWLILYPLRFQHAISANNIKNYKCSKGYYSQYQFNWWSTITSFSKRSLIGTKNVILSLIGLQPKEQNEQKNLPHCRSHLSTESSNITSFKSKCDPKCSNRSIKSLTKDNRKETKNVMFPLLRQSNEQPRPKHLLQCRSHPSPDRKYTLAHADGRGWVIKPVRSSVRPKKNRFMQVFDKLFGDASSHHTNVNKCQQTPCVRRRINTAAYYARCSTAKNKKSKFPDKTQKTAGSTRSCAQSHKTIYNPAGVTNCKPTVANCQTASSIKSIAEKMLDSVCSALTKRVHEVTRPSRCLENKRSRSAIGVRRPDPELVPPNLVRSRSVSEKDDCLVKRRRRKKSERIARTECGPLTCQTSDSKNMTSPTHSRSKKSEGKPSKCGPLTCQPSDPKNMTVPVRRRSVSKMDESLHKRSRSKLEERNAVKCGPLTCQPGNPQDMTIPVPIPLVSKMDNTIIKCSCKKSECKTIECSPLCKLSDPQPVSKMDNKQTECNCHNLQEPIPNTERGPFKCECHSSDPHNVVTSPARNRSVSNKYDSKDKRVMERKSTKHTQAFLPTPKLKRKSVPVPVQKRKDSPEPKRKGSPVLKRKDSPVPSKRIKKGEIPHSSRSSLYSKNVSKKKPKTYGQRLLVWLRGLCGSIGSVSKELNESINRPKCTDMFLKTLRSRPCFWVYDMCPQQYPLFLKQYYCARNCFHFFCGALAICFWAPIICSWYACLQLCTGCC